LLPCLSLVFSLSNCVNLFAKVEVESSLAIVFISVTVTVVLLVIGLFIASALRHAFCTFAHKLYLKYFIFSPVLKRLNMTQKVK
jgi:hypothetical protein